LGPSTHYGLALHRYGFPPGGHWPVCLFDALPQRTDRDSATGWQATLAILAEARIGVVVSVIAGFGSVISEVGAVILVGGNIEGKTRTLTTAIVLETRKGNFDLAMALGIILLFISFLINLAMIRSQGRDFAR
jgi:ABC-type tungstate transport system substrate-binding protein